MLIIISSFLPTLCQVVNDDDDNDDDNDDDISRDVAKENDDSSDMMVDVLESELHLNPVNMQVDDPRPKGADEIEDGWVQVAGRRRRGKGIRLKQW